MASFASSRLRMALSCRSAICRAGGWASASRYAAVARLCIWTWLMRAVSPGPFVASIWARTWVSMVLARLSADSIAEKRAINRWRAWSARSLIWSIRLA